MHKLALVWILISNRLKLIDFSSPYKLEIFDGLNSTPVDVTAGSVNNTYYSDVVISLTSNDYKGNFKLEYFPGRLLSMYSIFNPHPIQFEWQYSFTSWVIYFNLGPLTYREEENNFCSPSLKPTKRYDSLLEAKTACSINEKCAKFYDYQGKNRYYLCEDSSRSKASKTGSILYTKQEGIYK